MLFLSLESNIIKYVKEHNFHIQFNLIHYNSRQIILLFYLFVIKYIIKLSYVLFCIHKFTDPYN